MEHRRQGKARVQEIAEELRKSGSHEARLTIEMIAIMLDELKTSLVSAGDTEFLRVQGAAREFERLHGRLTVVPPNKGD